MSQSQLRHYTKCNKKQWQNKMVCSCLVLGDYALQLWTSFLNDVLESLHRSDWNSGPLCPLPYPNRSNLLLKWRAATSRAKLAM